MKTEIDDAIVLVRKEIDRATVKFPNWPTDPVHALAIVAEEIGELQKEVLQMTYEPSKTNSGLIMGEAVQVAAMAIRFISRIDSYKYEPSEQS
jgi:hypothetical protein